MPKLSSRMSFKDFIWDCEEMSFKDSSLTFDLKSEVRIF
jgi:hypothetical protein